MLKSCFLISHKVLFWEIEKNFRSVNLQMTLKALSGISGVVVKKLLQEIMEIPAELSEVKEMKNAQTVIDLYWIVHSWAGND